MSTVSRDPGAALWSHRLDEAGTEMMHLVRRLYPICRSITGDGVRETLGALGQRLALKVHEVPTGTRVFDWIVPKEWNVRDAWIADSSGHRVVDFRDSSLHLLNYSTPLWRRMSLEELRPHLHTLPEQPDRIPYRTSYYEETWGFCLSHERLESLADGEYEVAIETTLEPGHLTYAECLVPGDSDDEVLISCHVCHPSLANDNLSGIAVAALLAEDLAAGPRRRLSTRFLFIPGTIGSITWLARSQPAARRVKAGLVAANLGDPGRFHYKKSRRGSAAVDRAAQAALAETGEPFEVEEFVPYGYDERQYCSPGFDLPVGSLTRTPYGRYPEYHTSADNPDFLRPESLAGSLALYRRVLDLLDAADLDPTAENVTVVEDDGPRYLNLNPRCEPQLGRRGLYGSLGGSDAGRVQQLAMLWVLNLSDGRHTLPAIVRRSGMPREALEKAAARLLDAELLRRLE